MDGATIWVMIGMATIVFILIVLYSIFTIVDDKYMDNYREPKKKKGKK